MIFLLVSASHPFTGILGPNVKRKLSSELGYKREKMQIGSWHSLPWKFKPGSACILFRIFGSGPKFQRCLPLGTKAPGKGICQYLGTTLPGANNVFPVEWWGLLRVAHPHRQLPRTALQTYSWDPNRIKTGQGPFLWQSWKHMMRCFLPFGSSKARWFTADLRLGTGSSFGWRA